MKNDVNKPKSLVKKLHAIITTVLALSILSPAVANNIAVSNATLTGQNTSAGVNNAANYCLVRFDLSWDNSWHSSSGPSNWDAAYVFIKYRIGTTDYTLTGASSSGTTITVSSTTGLRVGMEVEKFSGTGNLQSGTEITAITSATTFTINQTPSSALSSASIYVYRKWYHAYLNNSGHYAGAGADANVQSALVYEDSAFNSTTNPAVGAFFYRSTDGSGTFSVISAQLRWNYGASGTVRDSDKVDIKVFAIEMVYVPQGSFYLGDGKTSSPQARFSKADSTSKPFLVTSEDALTLGGTAAGNLGNNNSTGQSAPLDDFNNSTTKTLPAAFPKGFAAFYCFKYPPTCFQISEFMNTLTRTQQINFATVTGTVPVVGGTGGSGSIYLNSGITMWARMPIAFIGPVSTYGRVTIGCNADGDTILNESNDGLGNPAHIALQINGLCSYADWAGLRFMSEMEFEKMCRGPLTPVVDEFAWGSTSYTSATSYNNAFTRNETPNTGNVGRTGEVIRVGAFAAGSNVSRANAGASYYGVMNIHDHNYYLPLIHVGIAAARNFTRTLHGNGQLTNLGYADISTWPGYVTSANSSTNAGWGYKNIDNTGSAAIARRNVAATTTVYGGHTFLVHSAPSSAAE